MKLLAYVVAYIISYIFGAFSFPQIIGSIRMIMNGIKSPYVFTLVLWVCIFVFVTLIVYLYLSEYFPIYLVTLVIPFVITIQTKKIE